ncbi:MAG: GNAT family N-acetyltransferase [Lachnospiraceae bacterium]|nr:GNAT family N-acetyltransferase [Lachnospiraceae bacterium]
MAGGVLRPGKGFTTGLEERSLNRRMENTNKYVQELYEYAALHGLPEESLLTKQNLDRYVYTAVDSFRDYPLFQYLFKGDYIPGVFAHMLTVDFRNRIPNFAGLSDSSKYRSIILLDPPEAEKPGMGDYLKTSTFLDYLLVLVPALHRMEKFEDYALNERKPFMNNKTWYLYIFTTRKKAAGRGYGSRVMKTLLGFAEEKGYRICLETNDEVNIGLYEHFGFRLMLRTNYKDVLEHYIMLYSPGQTQGKNQK